MVLSLPFLIPNMSQRLQCCKYLSDSIVATCLLRQDCEIWALKEHDNSEITAAEMKILRKSAKYTLFDYKKNQYILGDLRTQPIFVITKYVTNFFACVSLGLYVIK